MIVIQARDNLGRKLAPGNIVVYNKYLKGIGMIWEGVFTVLAVIYEMEDNRWGLSLAERNGPRKREVYGNFDSLEGWRLDNANVIKIAEGEGAL